MDNNNLKEMSIERDFNSIMGRKIPEAPEDVITKDEKKDFTDYKALERREYIESQQKAHNERLKGTPLYNPTA